MYRAFQFTTLPFPFPRKHTSMSHRGKSVHTCGDSLIKNHAFGATLLCNLAMQMLNQESACACALCRLVAAAAFEFEFAYLAGLTLVCEASKATQTGIIIPRWLHCTALHCKHTPNASNGLVSPRLTSPQP
jgi:hypothetical protein